MRRGGLIFAIALLCLAAGCGSAEGPTRHQVVSPSAYIARPIPEGTGPRTSVDLSARTSYPEPVWLTGAHLELLDKDGKPLSPELAAHLFGEGSLSFMEPARHTALHKRKRPTSPLIFPFSADCRTISLPQGYGIPMLSNEALLANVQWKNTHPYLRPTEVKFQIEVVSTTRPQAPLRVESVFALTLVRGENAYYDLDFSDPKLDGPGVVKAGEVPGSDLFTAPTGSLFAWRSMVPRGQQTNVTPVTHQLKAGDEIAFAVPFRSQGLERLELDRTLPRSSDPVLAFDARTGFAPRALNPPLRTAEGQRYTLKTEIRNSDPVNRPGWGIIYLYSSDKDEPAP